MKILPDAPLLFRAGLENLLFQAAAFRKVMDDPHKQPAAAEYHFADGITEVDLCPAADVAFHQGRAGLRYNASRRVP